MAKSLVKLSALSAMRKFRDGWRKKLNIKSKPNSSWGSFRPTKESIFPIGNKSGILFGFCMNSSQK
jgi:hypothetical protein